MLTRHVLAVTALATLTVATGREALAQTNGTWNAAAGGDWDTSASWSGGAIADGAGATANFSTIDVSGVVGVTLSTPRTVGTLNFGDTAVATPGGWSLSGADLTLAGATPTISVGALASGSVVDLTNVLAGATGFTKTGPGTLVLSADNNTPENGLTGNIRVNEGALTLNGPYKATQFIDMANGTVLIPNVAVGDNPSPNPGVGGVRLAAGSTVAINNDNGSPMAGVSGAGATLNLNLGVSASADQNWAATGNMTALNVTGTIEGAPAALSMRIVGGSFNANSFSNTTVTLNNATLGTNTNSGGNTVQVGALAGNATSTLEGGANGTFVSYQIGGLNSSTTFAGNITPGNGLNLIKVGTGTLTLSGALSYQPTANADVGLRGGVTRVENGTLKLVGATTIPGGVDDATLSTIDVRAAGTLDVSEATTTYNTAAFQQVIGAGKITGNFNHGAGVLAPGDTNVGGVSQTLTATAGTLTFNNALSFAGTGQINFDVSPSLSSGNDLIQVAGADLAGAPVVHVGFLGGATTGAYTLLNSTAPPTGSLAGWTVAWEGRGAAPTLSLAGNQVKLNISSAAAGNLHWSGGVDGVWNAGAAGTANWRNTGTNAADKFFQLDAVSFLDTSDGVNPPINTVITLNVPVSPSSVLVNNSAVEYTISGTGRITGGTSLVKQGTGTLNLTTPNNYAGGTTVSGGIIALAGTGMLGGGAVTLNGGAVHAGAAGNFNMPNNIVVVGTGNRIANSNAGAQTLNLQGVISGSGALTLDNVNGTGTNGIDLHGVNSGLTGSAAVGPTTAVFIRARNPNALGTNVAWDLGANASTLASRIDNTPTSFQLGSLTGGASTRLGGHESGAGATSVNWTIGGLNTSTTFDGIISNGGNTPAPTTRPVSIAKVGTGTLTLTNFNTYTGMTRVLSGALSITNAYLGDTSDVFVLSGSTFNLNFAGQDTIRSLFVNGVPQPAGTYNASNSPFITGTGELVVTAVGAITGDFDGNFIVDGNDFLLIQRAGAPGSVFAAWRAQYGTTPPVVTAVPEPGMLMLAASALGILASAGRRRAP